MKKQQFLTVDWHSTVKITPSERRQIERWLAEASPVLQNLFAESIIPGLKIQMVHVSLLLCGDKQIQKLNKVHRGKDKVTDVLSFPAQDNLRKSKSLPAELFLGDLAICHQQTRRQAKQFGISYLDEFIHLFFHGVIHLLGYDHELSLKEEKLMEAWEKKALDLYSAGKKKGAR